MTCVKGLPIVEFILAWEQCRFRQGEREERREKGLPVLHHDASTLFHFFVERSLFHQKAKSSYHSFAVSQPLGTYLLHHGSSIRRSRNDRGQGAFPSTLFNICVVNCFIFSAQSQIFAIPTSNHHHIITRVKMPVSHHSSVQSQSPT